MSNPRSGARIWRHLITDHRSARRAFPQPALERIETAIAAGEAKHRGQVQFAVEPALHLARVLKGQSARERSLEVFSELRIWDTEENCGVLVYLLLADRDVELVADRGIDRLVGAGAWDEICRTMETHFGNGDFATGLEAGIAAINNLLIQHFPRGAGARTNELPDRPLFL